MRCQSVELTTSWMTASRLILISAALLRAGLASGQEYGKIGPTTADCAAPTVVGVTQCKSKIDRKEPEKAKVQPKPIPAATAAANPAPESSKAEVVIGGVKESEVDAYLANHGKPPREAVRAMLNPSDENVAALLKREREQLAVVAYVANRRLEIGQVVLAGGAGANSQLNPNDLPSLIGMRVTVLVSPDCNGCDTVLQAVNQLVTEFPSVDGRIGVVGQYDQREFLIKTSALGVLLPISPVNAERIRKMGIRKFPAVLIGDSRFSAETMLADEVNNALDLEMKLVTFRKLNEKNAPGKPVHRREGNPK